MKYRKKPVDINAVQWKGDNFEEIKLFANNSETIKQPLDFDGKPYGILYINTLEGRHIAKVGDYIIKGVKGEFYPCKPEIFQMTYEEVEE